jgi:hypothetical protein
MGKPVFRHSSGMAQKVLRYLSEHPDQILKITRLLVPRTRACARLRASLRSIELRSHRVQISNPIRGHLHDHVDQIRHSSISFWPGRS